MSSQPEIISNILIEKTVWVNNTMNGKKNTPHVSVNFKWGKEGASYSLIVRANIGTALTKLNELLNKLLFFPDER